ncbi:MAG: universal stress protein [Coriobacteriales bacterium]|jgi:nucleotide-binding universal stress UspA family protein
MNEGIDGSARRAGTEGEGGMGAGPTGGTPVTPVVATAARPDVDSVEAGPAWLLVGIDGTERGENALRWAVERARRTGAGLSLVRVIESDADDAVARRCLDEACAELAQRAPEVPRRSSVVKGDVVGGLVKASAGHTMIVMGSHRKRTLGEVVTGARGLRVSVAAKVPTAVISCDWEPAAPGEGIVAGVGPDDSSAAAVEFAAGEALSWGEGLELISAWGLPPAISKPAEAMGGGLSPVGAEYERDLAERTEALRAKYPTLDVTGSSVEGPSPAKVLLDRARGHRMLVLGTHGRSALGRLLLGSVGSGALAGLAAPTVIVPRG